MSKETRYAMYFIAFMMSVKMHKYKIWTIYYRSELSGGHCRSAATMPLHVVCRGEECRSVTSVISPRGGRCTGGCRPAGTACPECRPLSKTLKESVVILV